jgi:hypothetical protein
MAKKRSVKKAVAAPEQVEELSPDVLGAFATLGDKLPPRLGADGRYNPDYYAAMMECIAARHAEAVMTGERPPSGTADAMKAVMSAAKLAGVDLEGAMDRRSPQQIEEDYIRRLVEAPEAILESEEELLDRIEKSMIRAVAMTDDDIKEKVAQAQSIDNAKYSFRNPPIGSSGPAQAMAGGVSEGGEAQPMGA